MAVQSKTLVNDVGSAVVDELASQLNRASCSTPMRMHRLPIAVAGTAAIDTISIADDATASDVIFIAHEACLVTAIRFAATGVALSASTPNETGMCIVKVAASGWTDGGGDSADQLYRQLGVHGNESGVKLGAVGDYTVEFLTDGNPFTAANGCDDGQVHDLFDSVATMTAGLAAGEFAPSLVAQNHAAVVTADAKSLPSGGIAMNAGDALVMAIRNNAGAVVTSWMTSIGYRPVKDQLNLSPTFTQKTFHTKAR